MDPIDIWLRAVAIFTMPGERQPRRVLTTRRPSYSTTPLPPTGATFWQVLDGLAPAKVLRFDAWAAERAMPLNLTTLMAFQAAEAAVRRVPAKDLTGGDRSW